MSFSQNRSTNSKKVSLSFKKDLVSAYLVDSVENSIKSIKLDAILNLTYPKLIANSSNIVNGLKDSITKIKSPESIAEGNFQSALERVLEKYNFDGTLVNSIVSKNTNNEMTLAEMIIMKRNNQINNLGFLVSV